MALIFSDLLTHLPGSSRGIKIYQDLLIHLREHLPDIIILGVVPIRLSVTVQDKTIRADPVILSWVSRRV